MKFHYCCGVLVLVGEEGPHCVGRTFVLILLLQAVDQVLVGSDVVFFDFHQHFHFH
jgi:hypothetical protein